MNMVNDDRGCFSGDVPVGDGAPVSGPANGWAAPRPAGSGMAANPVDGPNAKPPLDRPWYGIGFGNAVVRFFRKTFVYGGRASRGEYWWAWLFMLIVDVAVMASAYAVASVLGVSDVAAPLGSSDVVAGFSPLDDVMQVVTVILALVWILPSLSLGVRRLHDENLSGWWYLVPLALEIGVFAALFGGVVAGAAAVENGGSAQVLIVSMLGALCMDLLSTIVGMVLMILPSNPRGARFDRHIMRDAPQYRESSGFGGPSVPSVPIAPSGR